MTSKNTYVEYTLSNGETIKCTVAFKYLLKLREKNKRIYEKLNTGLLNGINEMAESAYILFGSYLCACYAGENGGEDNPMNEATFVDLLGDDIIGVMVKCSEFINKKKN